MRDTIKLTVVTLALGLLGGCAPRHYLVDNFTMGDRSVKYVLIPLTGGMDAGGKKEALYDFAVRICSLDKQGAETGCKETTVVQNVVNKTVN